MKGSSLYYSIFVCLEFSTLKKIVLVPKQADLLSQICIQNLHEISKQNKCLEHILKLKADS